MLGPETKRERACVEVVLVSFEQVIQAVAVGNRGLYRYVGIAGVILGSGLAFAGGGQAIGVEGVRLAAYQRAAKHGSLPNAVDFWQVTIGYRRVGFAGDKTYSRPTVSLDALALFSLKPAREPSGPPLHHRRVLYEDLVTNSE